MLPRTRGRARPARGAALRSRRLAMLWTMPFSGAATRSPTNRSRTAGAPTPSRFSSTRAPTSGASSSGAIRRSSPDAMSAARSCRNPASRLATTRPSSALGATRLGRERSARRCPRAAWSARSCSWLGAHRPTAGAPWEPLEQRLAVAFHQRRRRPPRATPRGAWAQSDLLGDRMQRTWRTCQAVARSAGSCGRQRPSS